jgi:hypothetical protein
MKQIITGFEIIEDVEKTLEFLEKQWVKRSDWDKLTEFDWWKAYFEEYQNDWWLWFKFKNIRLDSYWSLNCFLEDEKLEQINFKSIINETMFKEWEEVYVSDKSVEDALKNKDKRIYLWTFWKVNACVCKWFEEYYKDWEYFVIANRKYIAKIPAETKTKREFLMTDKEFENAKKILNIN